MAGRVRPRPDAGASRPTRTSRAPVPRDSCCRDERQVDRDTDDRRSVTGRGEASGRLHVAARERLGGAHLGGRRGGGLRTGRRADQARRDCRRRDAVRGAHCRGTPRVRRTRGGGRGRRGGPGRATRRDQRRGRRDRAADQRFARAHRGTRRHDGADREREACRGSCGQSSCLAGQPVRRIGAKDRRDRDGRCAKDGRNLPRAAKPTLSCASSSRGASSGAAESSGTARTRRPARRGSGSASTSRSRSSSPRSWPTRTLTACSTTWPRLRRAWSQPRPTTRAHCPPSELAARAAPRFAQVEIEPDPHVALARARQSSTGLILVTGSLYLLANLAKAEEQGVR